MIRTRGSETESDANTDIRAPRISWSVLVMGIGVVASIVLNYAAYDTRITVLEENKLVESLVITDLKAEITSLRGIVHDLDVRTKVVENDIKNEAAWLLRSELKHDKIDERILDLEKKKGK